MKRDTGVFIVSASFTAAAFGILAAIVKYMIM
jgi:hypothetical protein